MIRKIFYDQEIEIKSTSGYDGIYVKKSCVNFAIGVTAIIFLFGGLIFGYVFAIILP